MPPGDDHYIQSKALSPQAKFYFVGHSNGTYLLACALKAYAAVRFEKAYLCGSVLPEDFEWGSVHAALQLNVVRNDCATKDCGSICLGSSFN